MPIGKISVICGPMFCGKTEETQRRIRRLRIANKNVMAFNHEIDVRYGKRGLVSHNGDRMDAISVKSATEILDHTEDSLRAAFVSDVFVDEGQFFDRDLISVCIDIARHGINVTVAGLDKNFRGEPFGSMPQILAIADEVLKLTAVCSICGGDATRTQRLVEGKPALYNSPLILVGATDSYTARCRDHHEVLHVPLVEIE